ncbi:MAG: hypothetical protein E7373_06560 [Clostridiales bacterium]|nr:hypothetical protein [Clostridiales bacterium]
MTNELEEQFFRTFGIEPKIYKTDGRDIDDNGDVCSWYIEEVYPEITDRKLLEMICIMNKHIHKHNEYALCPVAGEILEEVKNHMLRLFNFNQPLLEKNFIQEIQQLFKEEK